MPGKRENEFRDELPSVDIDDPADGYTIHKFRDNKVLCIVGYVCWLLVIIYWSF